MFNLTDPRKYNETIKANARLTEISKFSLEVSREGKDSYPCMRKGVGALRDSTQRESEKPHLD